MNSQTQMTEAQIDELIIGVAAKLHQKTFEAGKHDHPWCEEVEKQHRLFLRFIQFEKKNSLYEEFSENLKKLEEEDEDELEHAHEVCEVCDECITCGGCGCDDDDDE